MRHGKKVFLSSVLAAAMAVPCFAGKTLKWEEIPKPVQEAVLANGGSAGPVDKEPGVVNGKAVYEASVKDKNGSFHFKKDWRYPAGG